MATLVQDPLEFIEGHRRVCGRCVGRHHLAHRDRIEKIHLSHRRQDDPLSLQRHRVDALMVQQFCENCGNRGSQHQRQDECVIPADDLIDDEDGREGCTGNGRKHGCHSHDGKRPRLEYRDRPMGSQELTEGCPERRSDE